MKTNRETYRVKGFTIVEMVVVVAIIGILLGVLAPSMMAYIQKARVQAANANAKMVYNAAQTEVQKYINKDRASTFKSGFEGDLNLVYFPGKSKMGSFGSNAPTNLTNLLSAGLSGAGVDACSAVIDNVNSVVSGAKEICWAVTVQNYIVKGAVSADFESSRYIGYYSANKTKAAEKDSSGYAASNRYFSVLRDEAVTGYGA